jgi:PD-(D/E)XK nuclease superfamily
MVKNKKISRYSSQRMRNLYDPLAKKPFKLSRSKLEMFLRCSRCFYLDRKLGVGQPPGYPFTLNLAVDVLLKKEFDRYRVEQKPHPICLENNLEAIPFKHDDIDRWRNSLHAGIQYIVPNTNIMLYGGLDDVWIDPKNSELMVVDYKATAKTSGVSLDAEWQVSYKRQAEIYQWLLRRNGFVVSDTAYFVYCNGQMDADSFDKQLKFDITLLPYEGSDSWVEAVIMEAYECLRSDDIPPLKETCDYCQYWCGINKHVEKIKTT